MLSQPSVKTLKYSSYYTLALKYVYFFIIFINNFLNLLLQKGQKHLKIYFYMKSYTDVSRTTHVLDSWNLKLVWFFSIEFYSITSAC